MYPFYQSQQQQYQPFSSRQKYQQKPQSMDKRRELRNTQLPALPSKLVTHHCNVISQKGNVISTAELTRSLDEVVRELKRLDDQQQLINLNDIVAVLILVRSSTLISVVQHHFFALLQTPLIQFLQQWRRASYLNENDAFTFRNITKLLKKLFKNATNINLYPSWLSDSSLLESFVACLTDIATSSKFLNDKNERETKNFTRLLNIYTDYQQLLSDENTLDKDKLVQLLDPVTQCLTSPDYIDSFHKLLTNKTSSTAKGKFFLFKCPSFLTSYTGSRLDQTMDTLLSAMLPQYVSLLDKLISSVDQWKRSMIRAVNHLLNIFNLGSTNGKVFATHLPLIDHVLKLIDTPSLYNNLQETLSNPETVLIDTGISFLVNMIHEPAILAHIKQKQVTPLFLRLTSAKYEPLMYNAYTILAHTTSEEDIKGMHNSGKLLSTVIKLLKTTIDQKPNNQHVIDQLLETLKGLVQHDQMKEELLKQNALPFLLECTNKLSRESLTLALETLWTMTFLKEAALILRTNSTFIEKVQMVSKTNSDEGMKKAADGLVWKLVREPAFLEKIAEEGDEDETLETTKVHIGEDGKEKIITGIKRNSIAHAERVFDYDIMISYCHADKDLIIKIHKFLIDKGFKIWIDLDNMFGPAMSAMAEAVENSEFVIMCMSDSYKQSTYCQAEAEYAFNCKRRLLPLIVRQGYKPDGWLGFMIGSRIYVDFGRFDFETACEKLMNEISLQRKRPLPSKANQVMQHEKPAVTAPEVVQAKPERSPGRSSVAVGVVSDVYMNRKAATYFNRKTIDQWLESDVLDFLFAHRLHELMPLCEKMDGRALIQLYKMCSSRSSRTYSLLNDELKSTQQIKLPIGIYTRFLSVMEREPIPPSPQRMLQPPVLPPQSMLQPPVLPPQPMLQPPLLPLQLILPSPMPPLISPTQPFVPVSNLPYDILVTSNASVSQMLKMVTHMGPQLQGKHLSKRRVRFPH